MARIFISHSSKNNAEALAVRDWLVAQGWNDLFLDIHPTSGLLAGEHWQTALRTSIGRCRAVIFCISPEWCDSETCQGEFSTAMRAGAAPIGVIVKALPIERIPDQMTKEWQIVDLTLGGSPVMFQVAPPPSRLPVTITFPAEELQRLRAGLAKLGLAGFDTTTFVWPPPEEPDRAPYRGLAPLDTLDAGVFFGRGSDLVRAREELIALRAKGSRQLFVILGASGAGKSSFLRAGLLPRLQREDRDFLVLPIIRPGVAPLNGEDGLVASLAGAFERLKSPRAPGEIRRLLQQTPHTLPPLLSELVAIASSRLVGGGDVQVEIPPTIVLSIDQAEELFTAGGGAETEAFLQHIVAAVRRGPDTIVVATIRSDRYEPLQLAAKRLDLPVVHPFDLGPVTPYAFREAILRPAERSSPPIVIDSQLRDKLIADTAAQGADPLPLLAFTLQRLYLEFGRATRKLTLGHYEALGGLTGSIDAALKEAFANPASPPVIPADPAEQESVLEATFVPALADINESNDEPARRIAPEAEIPELGRGILARLIDKRLLVRGVRKTADGSKEPTIEVAHEALLRQWPTLRRMLDRRAADLKALQTVERSAQAWQQNHRLAEWLEHRGERLTTAEALASQPALRRRLEGVPGAYLTACREGENRARQAELDRLERERVQIKETHTAQDQTRRFQRRMKVALYGLLTVSLATLGGALWKLRETNKREAQVMTSVAQRSIADGYYDRAMRIAIQGLPPKGSLGVLKPWSHKLEAKIASGTLLSQMKFQIKGHEDQVMGAAFSPDGERIATASLDMTARLWNATTGKLLMIYKGHQRGVMGVAFSPDGRRIVTASLDHTARVWDTDTGAGIFVLSGHKNEVRSAAFSPDGRRIATASFDKSARIWDAGSGREIAILQGHSKAVVNVQFSPDGTRIATASHDKTARLWDASQYTEIKVFSGHEEPVWCAAFSPDGSRIVTASYDNTARIWDVESGLTIKTIDGHKDQVRTAAFSPDGARIVTTSSDKTVRVWDVVHGFELAVLRGHDAKVWSAVFSPDGALVVSASYDKTARVWDVKRSIELAQLWGHEQSVRSAAFSPDGKRIVTASYDNSARVWDAGDGKELLKFKGHADQVRSAAFSPDGTKVVTASSDKTAHIWDAATGAGIRVLEGHDGAVYSAAFSPDGMRIVTASADNTARLWDAATGAKLTVLRGHTERVNSAVFSPDGGRIATASHDRTLRIWVAASGNGIATLKGHEDSVLSAAFSPDGARIVTASQDRTARIWDVRSGKMIAVLRGHEGDVTSAQFSADGTWIVTSSQDKTARLWDAARGIELAAIPAHTEQLYGAAFSPDGARIVTASADSTARVWDVRRATLYHGDALREYACREKLIGAEAFTHTDAQDPVLDGLEGTRPCENFGPLAFEYWQKLATRWAVAISVKGK